MCRCSYTPVTRLQLKTWNWVTGGVWRDPEEDRKRVLVNKNVGMGILSHTKVGIETEFRRKRERLLGEQWGGWERHGTEHQSGPTSADNGEIGGNYVSGKTGEPLLPT